MSSIQKPVKPELKEKEQKHKNTKIQWLNTVQIY